MRSPGLAQEAYGSQFLGPGQPPRGSCPEFIFGTNWGWIVMAVSGLPRQFGSANSNAPPADGRI